MGVAIAKWLDGREERCYGRGVSVELVGAGLGRSGGEREGERCGGRHRRKMMLDGPGRDRKVRAAKSSLSRNGAEAYRVRKL